MTAECNIPLRCQTCYRFRDLLSEIQTLEGESYIIGSTRYDLEKTFSREEIESRLAAISLRITEAQSQIEHDKVYSVGCPGVDLSKSVGTGEPIQTVQCRTPLKQ